MLIRKIAECASLRELLELLDEFCMQAYLRDDDSECFQLKDMLEKADGNDLSVLLSAYLCVCEDGDEIVEAIQEFMDNCRGFIEADKEVTQQTTKAEFEAVLDECEDKCAVRTCIEKEYKLNVAEINMYSENDEMCLKIKENTVNLFLPRIDLNVEPKQYIAGQLGTILYDTLETKFAPEYIRQELNRCIPETRGAEESVRQLFGKYFYDVVLYRERKPGIYPYFNEHTKQIIITEFFKKIILQYLRE